jgi:hypothetical protein
LTSQGHPRTVFRRPLERGNLVAAELSAREVGDFDLREALELAALSALDDPRARRLPRSPAGCKQRRAGNL